jgi:hypothetical protein
MSICPSPQLRAISAAAALIRRMASCIRRTASTLPLEQLCGAGRRNALACSKAVVARRFTVPWHSGASSMTAAQ